MVQFHEFVALGEDDRDGKTPYILAASGKRLRRMSVSMEIVQLAEDRLLFWNQLRELAGLMLPESVKDAYSATLEAQFESRMNALAAEYEAKIADLKANYPRVVARRMAEGLLKIGDGTRTIGELLSEAGQARGLDPIGADVLDMDFGGGGVATAPVKPVPVSHNGGGGVAAPVAPVAAAPAAAPAAAADDDDLAMEPYIETERCTTCNECTNLNGKMFAYNENKQAYFKDVRAGTFAQMVQAAEKCPAGLIHPGTPLNPKEKELAKWIERAKPFN
jgi:ferredoxin